MCKNYFFLFILIMSYFAILTRERHFQLQFAFHQLRRNQGWTFLDRIKLGEGVAQIRFNAKMIVKQGQTSKEYEVQLWMVPDRLWLSQQSKKCTRDATEEVLYFRQNDKLNEKQNVKQATFNIILSSFNNYEFGLLQTVDIPVSQTYHFIFKDCQKKLISDYFGRQSRMIISLDVKNNGKDYGQDQQGNFFWFPFLIIGTGFLISVTKKSLNQKSMDMKDPDYVKYLVYSSIWFNFISLLFKYVGYMIYYFIGSEYNFFDFMYLFFHSVGDSIVISIFLFVSYGWTITFIKDKDFDLYVPLVCMMGLITVILTLLNKITDGAHDKYHMYDTIPSYLLVFFKAFTILLFLVGCIKTIVQSRKQQKIVTFMFQILFLGGLYLSSVPLVMLAAQYLPVSQRKQWVFIIIELGKIFISSLLTYMISYKKSGYRRISFDQKSFMQFGERIL